MRNIVEVIDEILVAAPAGCVDLVTELEKIQDSASYRAPELAYLDWQKLSVALMDNIGIPKKDWELEVLSIFSRAE
jgi:hypothetical protein